MADKLPKVQKGDPITAEAWNQVVEKINGVPSATITRGRRNKKKGINGITVSAAESSSSSTSEERETASLAFSPSQFYWGTNGTLVKKTQTIAVLDSMTVENGCIVLTTRDVVV